MHKLFYFTVTAAGVCYCAGADAPEVVWDPNATVRHDFVHSLVPTLVVGSCGL